jgi:K+-sensing histidine kinase KdpD
LAMVCAFNQRLEFDSHAWKYTDSGEVDVVVSEHAVSIHDTGRGLSEQEQRQVFEPFFRIQPDVDVGEAPFVRGYSIGLYRLVHTAQ